MLYEEERMMDNHYEIRETLANLIDRLKETEGDKEGFQTFLTDLAAREDAIDNDLIPLVLSKNAAQARVVSAPILGEGSTNLVLFAKGMVEEFSSSSDEVTVATNEIFGAIVNITSGVEEQSSAAEQIAHLTEDVLTSMKGILTIVQTTQESVSGAVELSEAGLREVEGENGQMHIILTNSDNITEEINELNEQTKKITKNVAVIKGIANQTNLLAPNASIEAARAGESGKGFAVVADEVRKLVDESSQASVSIEQVMKSITVKINRTVEVNTNNDVAVGEGQAHIKESGTTFNEIAKSITTVHQHTNRIQLLNQGVSSSQPKNKVLQ